MSKILSPMFFGCCLILLLTGPIACPVIGQIRPQLGPGEYGAVNQYGPNRYQIPPRYHSVPPAQLYRSNHFLPSHLTEGGDWNPVTGQFLAAPHTTPLAAEVATEKRVHSPFPRVPGDFEPQRALVLSVSDWQPQHAEVFKQIVMKTAGHTELLVLCNDRPQLEQTIQWLEDIKQHCAHVRFCRLELNTIWLRDFSPIIAETESGTQAIDFYYVGERPKDDNLPKVWAQRTDQQLLEVPWTLQGGNFLTNGKHLGITTSRIFQDNNVQFPNPLPGTDVEFESRKLVTDAIIDGTNMKELVVLEPLQFESTQHVDMFATFLAAEKIVVASVNRHFDPVNAAILDRNAKRLAEVKVDGRPLQVTRLNIPPRQGNSWSAFTNAILANDLVLMPVYNSDSPELIKAAVAVYERLLPEHTVQTIDITTLKQLQGELHCLSMSLPAFAPMIDRTIAYDEVVKRLTASSAKIENKPRRHVEKFQEVGL